MKDSKLKSRLNSLKDAAGPGGAYFVAGGIVAAHSVGMPEVDLVRTACDGLSHMASLFPFHDAALGLRSFYEGAIAYTASVGIGLADWVAESGEMVSRHIREAVHEMQDWAGDHSETLRNWFHASLSKSGDFLSLLKDQAGTDLKDKAAVAWGAFEAVGAAFGSYKALQAARKYAVNKLRGRESPEVDTHTREGEAGKGPAASVIETLNINIAIGGEPAAKEAERQVDEALSSERASPDEAEDARGRRGIDLPVEVAEALAEKGVSRSDILWISDRLNSETRIAFRKAGRDADILPPEPGQHATLDGGLIFRSEPKSSREEAGARPACEADNHLEDMPWHH